MLNQSTAIITPTPMQAPINKRANKVRMLSIILTPVELVQFAIHVPGG